MSTTTKLTKTRLGYLSARLLNALLYRNGNSFQKLLKLKFFLLKEKHFVFVLYYKESTVDRLEIINSPHVCLRPAYLSHCDVPEL